MYAGVQYGTSEYASSGGGATPYVPGLTFGYTAAGSASDSFGYAGSRILDRIAAASAGVTVSVAAVASSETNIAATTVESADLEAGA